MSEFIKLYGTLFLSNWKPILVGGLIVVSVVIFLMGILKSTVFSKVKIKLLRKVLLAFTSIALVFPCVALYFTIEDISFDHYWVGCVFGSISTIILYWFYENTGFRNLIQLVGEKTVMRLFRAITTTKSEEDELKEALQKAIAESKKDVGVTLKQTAVKTAKDDDLKNL